MANGAFYVPAAFNEPVFSYAPGSDEREELKKALSDARRRKANIPMFIGGKEVRTKNRLEMRPPHDLGHVLGVYSKGDASHVRRAIDAAAKAKAGWESMPWEHRAAIFLKAADLLSCTYRQRMNAATMLAQSKNAYQSEIDAVCELADFWRYNVQFLTDIYAEQPDSSPAVWNRMEYRALEGFVLAITPFNFTSIAGNLPTAPALMGNTVVWKPANSQIYSAWTIMEILREAGLPDGVINLVYTDGPTVGEIAFNHPDFSGIHFTGSTGTFQHMWRTIGQNISSYKTYPRIVGETGGKDFVIAHPSSNAKQVATALSRGAFEFQGQKCSAASRAYIPSNLWPAVKEMLLTDLADFKQGPPEDFSNFVNAVIDEKAYNSITGFIAKAKRDKQPILAGGGYSKKDGYFIEPTVIQAKKADYRTMKEEIFGPVLTVYVYNEKRWSETLDLVDKTSPYGLTGAVFSNDRASIVEAADRLRHAAGNFYINDKPTGAVVGQQPFGGSRASGTNDKAGSVINLQRWVSPRAIKETMLSATDFRYPFLAPDAD